MDKNEHVRRLEPQAVRPEVHLANYIRVPPGHGWPRHTIDDLELVLVVNGEFTAADPDHAPTTLEAGDVLLIRPQRPCDLWRRAGNPAVLSCLHLELLQGAKWANNDYRTEPGEPWVVRARGDYRLVELFRQCAAEFGGYEPHRGAMMSALATSIWLRLLRHQRGGNRRQVSPRVRQMMSFLRKRLASPVTRRDLASAFELSPEYVNAIFRRELGTTPGRFLVRERVLAACRLLTQDPKTVAEVAYEVGYSDPLYFSRVFKSVTGMPPSRYRHQGVRDTR